MHIKVLGPGCKNCEKLAKNVQDAISELKVEAQFDKVTNMDVISNYAVMKMPALVIDEKVVLSGQVPSVAKLVKLLEDNK